jgi:DNA ligase-1
MSKDFKPMLASPADLDSLRYPLLASPKLDGIRAMVRGGRLVSRKLLDIPNRHIQNLLARPELEGLDGELIVGEPTAKDVYNKTVSFVMAQDKVGPFTYYVFDLHNVPSAYVDRLNVLRKRADHPHIQVHGCDKITDRAMLDIYEAKCVEAGYEGIMTRDPSSHYKHGRSTAKEQILLKVKRFEDSEAEIIGVEEEMHNGNDAGRDELGRTKRSTAKAGKTGKGTMGALVVRDIHTKVEFNIGTGFTAAQRAEEWRLGTIVKYKFFPVGVKVAPRHPVYLGLRDRIDMGVPA